MHAHSTETRPGFLDTAAAGIFPGLLGGIGMLVVLIAGGYLSGHTPGQVLGAFDTAGGLPLRGALVHLAVSCVYGILFAVLARGLAGRLRISWGMAALGPVYGLALWLLAVTLLRQAAAGLIAASTPAVFLLAHIAYGLALGLEAKSSVT